MSMPLFDRRDDRGDEPRGPKVLRVGELNRAARLALESDFRDVWVEGEVSDAMRASSGHIYFTLNDDAPPAQLKCVLFRSDAQRSRAKIEKGERVRVRGALTLYEPRGTYQLLARLALPAGEGDARAELERVRKRLEADGLLDPDKKRPLPRVPRVVGVVTSEKGAALHDIVRVASARCAVRIVVADCRVQGADAPASIRDALRRIQRVPDLDVVIIARGGGGAEELVAFNHEGVARAIAACRVPTVSGVGHETDVTLADLVADVRASTPSNAAERVVPERKVLLAELDGMERRLTRALEVRIGRDRLTLERLERRLASRLRLVSSVLERVDKVSARIARAARRTLSAKSDLFEQLRTRLARRDPRALLARDRARHTQLDARLREVGRDMLRARSKALTALSRDVSEAGSTLDRRAHTRLAEAAARLSALSPLAVLARGYAIVIHEGSGRALVRARDAKEGEMVRVRLHEGELRARVTE